VAYKHSEIFPHIVAAIDTLWSQTQAWVRRDDIVEYLYQKPEVHSLIQAAGDVDSQKLRWYIGNAIDWFSQQITAGSSPYMGQYDRQRLDGKWAYAPIGQAVEASVNFATLPRSTQPQPVYEISSQIGSGGQADVYKGIRKMVGEPNITVALKVYRTGFDEDELELLRLFDHPHVIKLLDTCTVNLFGREVRALVLEYADGGSLQDQIDNTKDGLPQQDILRVLRATAEALHHIHHFPQEHDVRKDNSNKYIIHRDIKPLNILLVAGTPKVSDVGIAKKIPTTTVLHSALWQTYAYSAPEMFGWGADKPTVSPKADIYALGISAYQMATGNLPFHGKNWRFPEWRWQHQNSPIPSHPRITGWLQEFIENCTVKDYKKRWESEDVLTFLA
jgi:serine/threonine protein kinase